MQDYLKSLVGLATMGALIGVAKLLVSSNEITVRVVIGRAILGSATSMLAGAVLIQLPDIPPLALLAVGSGLGIIGQQYIESLGITRAIGLAFPEQRRVGPDGFTHQPPLLILPSPGGRGNRRSPPGQADPPA